MQDILVIGAGVIGQLSALQLASAGLRVTLVDAAQAGQESSWAGGGIISPLYPWRYSPAVTALAQWSQAFYPRLAGQLLAQTNIDPEVHATGLFWLDLEDEMLALQWAQALGKPLVPVDMAQVRTVIPALGDGFTRAVHMPGLANVRNPRLLKALRVALLQLPNLCLQENAAVTGFITEAGRVCGVQTRQGQLRAGQVVLAAGAWSGELLAGLDIQLPVEPVKGQMILYQCAADFLPAMVLGKGRYAIPRRDGHVLVGSTLEHAGFDKTPTGDALASLKASAEALLPALAQAEVVGHWAGLRPGSPEGIPFIGEVPAFPGLWLNCGHYRNGLVLAPASCELLKNLLLDESPIVDPGPYSPAGRLGSCA
ncbi:glycine oxidase ThiO [Pseudomonas sp. N040]|uniref:glycine oxidase ThiO n=1 Tax=Pseudomonas sp. N040 TaxID=2785325 RepID=UPI0018A26BFD|nr:glycine oxidase ThiO [Pseudomonas sp. N040]MBF7730246.1 glycine oxidase ThiO [Pseudomonas sp. N040]MBW7013888.1 glycine oxidase ThiO [Pseudomonas sp. N040]